LLDAGAALVFAIVALSFCFHPFRRTIGVTPE
jgi:hypothetical protein